MSTAELSIPSKQNETDTTPRLPDFLIIGAAKSGTTTLYRYLTLHPRIFMSTVKEPEYFARDHVFRNGLDWYQQLFEESQPDQLVGEASTAYTRWPQFPHTASRIRSAFEQVKFIYLMRHPIDRAYSHYLHRCSKELFRGQPFPYSFEEHLRVDPMCLDGSMYFNQIEQYLEHFPLSDILFLFTEELDKDPPAILKKVTDFLGVEDFGVDIENIDANNTGRHMYHVVRKQVTGPFKAMPGSAIIRRILPESWKDWAYAQLKESSYGKRVAAEYLPPPLTAEDRERLVETFREPNRRLEELLGVDLSHWNE